MWKALIKLALDKGLGAMYLDKIICRLVVFLGCVLGLWGMLAMDCQAAPSHELETFHYKTHTIDGRKWLRIEIGMSRDKLDFEVAENPEKPYQLLILMKNTKRGDVKENIGLDRKIARYMTLKKTNKNDLQVMVAVDTSLEQHEYKVYTLEADKKSRKPYRLIIDIAADPPKPKEKPKQTDIPADEIIKEVRGRTIAIDAGHGGSDSGAIGPSFLKEKDVTLKIALEAARILRGNGARVVMTRYEDVDVYGPLATDKDELQARVDVARRDPSVEIFVSIHCNAFTNPEANGTGTYFHYHSGRDSMLAQHIQNEMVRATGLRDRGIHSARFYVLRHSRIPATLVETAFITNPNEERMLASASCQHAMALAICRGIGSYFRNISS